MQMTMITTISCVDIQGERGDFLEIRQTLKQRDGTDPDNLLCGNRIHNNETTNKHNENFTI